MSSSPSPFYSTQVREALVEIISNHEEQAIDYGPIHSSSLADLPSSTIRGKWIEDYESSSSTDDNDNNADGTNSDGSDDDDDSSTAYSQLEAVEEETQPAVSAANAEDHASTKNIRQGRGKQHHGKKSKNKKSKSDVLQKMGSAPSIVIPLDAPSISTTNNAKKKNALSSANRRALEIPNVLLPTNYLRDNPNWQAKTVAKTLLSTWDQLSSKDNPPTILVVLLQSGRFAAAAFSLQQQRSLNSIKMLAHKTSTRYTVRKGQGGSQSNHDQSKNKAKSIGAQLRREGEKQLRSDVHETWRQWKTMGLVERAMWVYVSCPKGMRRDYLFHDKDGLGLLVKGDERLRNVPLDVGRPTMEGTAAVVECVLSCCVREMTPEEQRNDGEDLSEVENTQSNRKDGTANDSVVDPDKRQEMKECAEVLIEEEVPVYTPLHEAIIDGDLPRLTELLRLLETEEQVFVDETCNTDRTSPAPIDYDVNTAGGVDHQTPLHLASTSSNPNAASLLNALLIQGHANPCTLDTRGRPPYFLASSDKHREAFRLARGALGEEYCQWDDDAKVGPAMSESDVQLKLAKAQEKKRRQRVRQKQKKADEKAVAQKAAAKEQKELEKKKQAEDAKRTRDGLKPKTLGATNVCDFCQTAVKRRSQMFQRLNYAYCSTDCVKRHQRELMAAAAAARMG